MKEDQTTTLTWFECGSAIGREEDSKPAFGWGVTEHDGSVYAVSVSLMSDTGDWDYVEGRHSVACYLCDKDGNSIHSWPVAYGLAPSLEDGVKMWQAARDRIIKNIGAFINAPRNLMNNSLKLRDDGTYDFGVVEEDQQAAFYAQQKARHDVEDLDHVANPCGRAHWLGRSVCGKAIDTLRSNIDCFTNRYSDRDATTAMYNDMIAKLQAIVDGCDPVKADRYEYTEHGRAQEEMLAKS